MPQEPEIFFKDTRFRLTGFGEAMVRLVTYTAYIVLVALAVLLFFSDIVSLHSVSLLLILFLIDRAIHFGKGEEDLDELGRRDRENVARAMTPAAYRTVSYAFRRALVTKERFGTLLLATLVRRREIRGMLTRMDIDPRTFMAKVESAAKETKEERTKDELIGDVGALACAAYRNAAATGERYIEPRNFLSALAAEGDPVFLKLLNLFNVKPEDVGEAVIFSRYERLMSRVRLAPFTLGGFTRARHSLRARVVNRAWTARPTPVLDRYSIDLTALAKLEKVGFLIGHEKEFDELVQVLARPGKPNALLVGEPGAGKSTMIAHLAYRMVKDKVPNVLFDKRLIQLDVGKLLANAGQDELSARIQTIVSEVEVAGNVVLCVPGIHDLFRTGGTGHVNAIDLLLPLVKDAAIPMIGDTFPREFKELIEPRTDFLDQFEVVHVDEISEQEAVRFLIYESLLLERQFKMFITFNAVRRAVALAHRYFRNKLLPGSASDLLKQALAAKRAAREKVLREDAVVAIAERQSKIPIQAAGRDESEKLLHLEDTIHERLIDQEEAVKAVARALREYRSGLSRKGGPIATFLFVGPTGVGKTELSKLIAEIQFGSKDLLLRFDMSEYQDKQSAYRFIGTPDGTKTGALTDAVREHPYALVLLDEFEKAHPDLLNIFLQVFDDGRLTDSLGRVADFENTIIIATSNAHSEFIKEEIEKGNEVPKIAEELKRKLTDYFKPELINRFSDIIVFRSLNEREIESVAGLLIKEVAALLKETNGIELRVGPDAVAKIAALGYSPVFGARPLRQVVSEQIRSVLAEKILRKEVARGNVLSVGVEDGALTFRVVE